MVPALGPDAGLSLPKIAESKLPNGLRLMIVEDHRQPVINMRLVLPAGIAQEPPGKSGLASIIANAIFLRPGEAHEAINTKVDECGAAFHASCENDYFEISVDGISTHAADYTDLIADVVEHPATPSEQDIAGYRETLPAYLKQELGNPATLASLALDRVVYGASAYGDLPFGTPKTLADMTPSDFRAFYARNFAPSTAVLIVVGDITQADASRIALKSLGAWTPAKAAATASTVPANSPNARKVPASGSKPEVTIIDRPGSQQTEIRIGAITGGYSDQQRIAGDIAASILGGGAFDNRLMHEIRVKRGLTYSISADFERYRDSGAFVIRTYTKNESTGEVVRLALAELSKIAASPPGAVELADHKTQLTGEFALGASTEEGLLDSLQEAVIYDGGTGSLARYASEVNAVTAEDVSRTIAELQLESLHIVLVGDAKVIEPQVKDIGAMTVIEPDKLDLTAPTLRRSDSAL